MLLLKLKLFEGEKLAIFIILLMLFSIDFFWLLIFVFFLFKISILWEIFELLIGEIVEVWLVKLEIWVLNGISTYEIVNLAL